MPVGIHRGTKDHLSQHTSVQTHMHIHPNTPSHIHISEALDGNEA